jgi:kumamolisin
MATMPSGYRALENSQRGARAGARRTGSADPNEVISVSIRVRRRSDAPALPDLSTLAANPRGTRHYISREDFAANYGASQEDIDKIAEFARANGLSAVESSIPRRTVVVKGTVAQMNTAFGVDLGMYETADEKYRGREGQIYVPSSIADLVEGVFGLDNRKMAQPQFRKSTKWPTGAMPAQTTVPLAPPLVALLYNFPSSPGATGQTIGIFEFGGGYKPSDVQLFYNSIGVTVPSITSVSVDGQPNNPGSDDYTVETLLDIGVSGSAAPGANLAVYFAPWSEQG